MQYSVYCDESRHTGGPNARFQVIGGLWIPTNEKDRVNSELRELRRSLGLNGEIKWTKVSRLKLDAYRKFAEYFFVEDSLKFRAIIVDQANVNFDQHHAGDEELGFYKFYYEMLEKWLLPGNEYLILLDFKTNKGATRFVDLKRCIQNYGSARGIQLRDLTVIDSRQSHLGQLCDLLTGAVSTDVNDPATGEAKQSLINKMAELRGSRILSEGSRSPDFSKFNVFRIDLSRGR